MYKYIFKRILFPIPTILGVIFIILLTMYFTPGDPARALLGVSAPQAHVDTLNHQIPQCGLIRNHRGHEPARVVRPGVRGL